MSFQLVLLGLIIGSNNLAAALALGALGQANRRWRIAFIFGCFEFFVPLVGLWMGQHSADLISTYASWMGPALLIGMGSWTIFSELRQHPQDDQLACKATTWHGLMLLAAGLSVDNLLIGFSLGLGRVSPLLLASVIACCSVCFTLLGLHLGNSARRGWERPTQIGAGLLLIGLGMASALGWL